MTFKISAASAEHLRLLMERTGVLVCGRRLYDMTSGWGGRHPMDRTVVVTHKRPDDRPDDDENFVFVTTGIEDAIVKGEGDRR